MKFVTVCCIITLLFCFCHSKTLENKVQTIELGYVSWGCACANWASPADIKRLADSGYKLSHHCIFIEPASASLALPDTFGFSNDRIRFTGQFYLKEGYPKEFILTEEQLEKARVFRYTKYEVLQSGYRDFIGNAQK